MNRTNLTSGAAAIPVDFASLALLPRWVLWKYEERGGNLTKKPIRVDGQNASVSNPKDWFDLAACKAVQEHLRANGTGVVLGSLHNGTCLAGIDLDNCRQDGTLTPWAKEIVERFASYTEISPSGSGVKLFFILTQADAASVRSHLGNRAGRKWSAGIVVFVGRHSCAPPPLTKTAMPPCGPSQARGAPRIA